VRPYTKGSLPRPRAVFDFVDRPELLEETLDENKKRRDEDQQRKGEDDRDVKLRGKASSAELVEGEGNAEGEYRWDSGINPIFFILPLCIGIGIYYYKRKKQKEDEQTNSESGANQRDTGYESEDVQVWRGALTANDPPLVTVKKTIITGDVEDGASITAQHELVIKGSFQGAHLTSSHDVSVESGINGQNKARLDIQGKLTTSYISEAILVCGTQVEVQKAIRNATVLSEGDVRVLGKNILGGVVASHAVIQTPAIGSDFCETKILLGQPLAKQCELTEQETPAWASEGEWNKASSLKVEEEWVSALVEHGDAKLDQKKAMPGPVETKIDPSDLTKIQIRGYQP
jgi:hypothetical protein